MRDDELDPPLEGLREYHAPPAIPAAEIWSAIDTELRTSRDAAVRPPRRFFIAASFALFAMGLAMGSVAGFAWGHRSNRAIEATDRTLAGPAAPTPASESFTVTWF